MFLWQTPSMSKSEVFISQKSTCGRAQCLHARGQQIARARLMGMEAVGRNQVADKRRVVETWKKLILERKVVIVQGKAR